MSCRVLYTANISDLKIIKRKLKVYYLIPNYGNDEVLPDKCDIKHYKNGNISWKGFELNYSQKLMKVKAMEWMQKVSLEAVSEDVVLVDKEKDANYSYRKLLVKRIFQMLI